MMMMRALVVAMLVAAPIGAPAQNLPWCSNFHDGGGVNCGFATYAQCMATAQGSGGYCSRNTFYVAPRPAMAAGHARRRRLPPSSR